VRAVDLGRGAVSGQESAGASSSEWTGWCDTDKDGLIMNLLAAEITARTGKIPASNYRDLTAEFGTPFLLPYRRAGDAGAEGASREAFS